MTAQSADALSRLRRAAESGTDVSRWTEYITALLHAGQKSRARKAAKSAPIRGDARKALVALAEKGVTPTGAPLAELVSLLRAGRIADARRVGQGLLKRYPDDPGLLNLMGVAALSAEDPVDAISHLERARACAPDNVDAISNLGLALVRQGLGDAAIRLLEPVALSDGAPLAARVNLASAYLRADRPKSALDLSVEILKDAPGDPDVMAIRASAHLALDHGAVARDILRPMAERPDFDLQDLMADALERAEGRATAMSYLKDAGALSLPATRRVAALLGEWGELKAAADMARHLAKKAPKDPAGYRMVGLFGRWQDDDPLIADMEAGLADVGLSNAHRGSFGLTLAKAKMDLGDDKAASRAMIKGNGFLRKTVDYSVDDDVLRFRQIAADWTPAVIEDLAGDDGPSVAPVFIVGLPRSGSTLIETVLSRHPAVTALGETPRVHVALVNTRNAATADAIKAVRQEVSEHLAAPRPGGIVTDKLLANFQYLGLLAAAFPKARFIETRRDLRAVGLSIFQAELGPIAHPYSMSLDEIGAYSVAYARLMDHWGRVLGDRLYRASYERLVSDPVSEIPNLVAAAGLDWHDGCLDTKTPDRRINTFSVAQARAPITTASVARWVRHEDALKPLIRILKKEGLIPD